MYAHTVFDERQRPHSIDQRPCHAYMYPGIRYTGQGNIMRPTSHHAGVAGVARHSPRVSGGGVSAVRNCEVSGFATAKCEVSGFCQVPCVTGVHSYLGCATRLWQSSSQRYILPIRQLIHYLPYPTLSQPSRRLSAVVAASGASRSDLAQCSTRAAVAVPPRQSAVGARLCGPT